MVYTYMRNEEGEFICPHCKAVKKNQNTMHYHLKKHEGDLPHECRHCKQRFLQLNILTLHLKSKHAEKENLAMDSFQCPCKDCNYISTTKANRRIHYFRIHMKEDIAKLYTCSEQNDKNYTCVQCNQVFKSHTAFYYHVGKCVKLPSEDPRMEDIHIIMA